MSEITKATAIAGSVLALGALGCGGNKASSSDSASTVKQPAPLKFNRTYKGPPIGRPKQTTLHCYAEQPDSWQPTPTNLNVAAIADRLGIPQSWVEAGKFGPAHCDEAIEASEVGTLARVKGIGSTCMTLGLGGTPPQAGVKYHEVLAFCAGNGQL